jgi:hypothetical protein
MPTDTTALDAEVQALASISDKPNLTALSYALRHPETWPADFVWDYSNCTRCAVGLALRLWPDLKLPTGQSAQETWIAREMAMSHREAVKIFFKMGPLKEVKRGWFRKEFIADYRRVRADDVADAIDRYLASA